MIALERVSKSFDGGASCAVRSVSLEVAPRTFIALVGDSGAGKTTLMKMINRLIDPDEGTVTVAGEPVRSIPAHVLRRRIGYVFQSVGLFPHMTIAQNIGITPHLMGWPAAKIRTRVEQLLDLVALPRAFLTRMPAELSGGQRQRVGIARALAARPSIMLMDEPFGALDAQTKHQMQEWLLQLWADFGKTVIFITHDVEEAIYLSDEVHVMASRPGRIIDSLDIALPRPRPRDIVTDPAFVVIKQYCLSLLTRHEHADAA